MGDLEESASKIAQHSGIVIPHNQTEYIVLLCTLHLLPGIVQLYTAALHKIVQLYTSALQGIVQWVRWWATVTIPGFVA